MDYNRYFAKEIYDFFLLNIGKEQGSLQSLDDYLKTIPGFITQAGDGFERIDYSLLKYVSKICTSMGDDGYLIKVSSSLFNLGKDKYISLHKVNSSNPDAFARDIEYGCLDYKYQGFPFAYNHLKDSVMPIVGINKKGDGDVGTVFYIGEGLFVTAAHCITGLIKFELLDSNNNPLEIKDIWFAKDEDPEVFDIAVIRTNLSHEIKPFLIEEPEILDSVMVIGYPPIPGMDAVQTVETATVGSWIVNKKASIGEVTAPTKSYLTNMDYFIITARVKGGNSGGPVVNENGKVIGLISQIPMDSQGGYDSGRFDIMGYGVCLPSKYISQLIANPDIRLVEKDEQGYYHLN